MTPTSLSRRSLLKDGGAALASLSVLRLAGPASAFPAVQQDAVVIPWLDQPAANPVPDVIVQQLDWSTLDDNTWQTPTDKFFVIKHFNLPELKEADWKLEVSGLVDHPMSLTLADLKARARHEVMFTIECSGNTGLPFFDGGIGNAKWAGTPLASVLADAGVQPAGTEVVFWGADAGDETYGDLKISEHFARSMSLADAQNPANLLTYEMNGEPLPPLHGFPLRLIAPGWYGIANVKWLTRIEVRDQRYAGNFMSRLYVTMREEERDGETVWTFSTVGRDRLKSAPAKVIQQGDTYSIMGAAWGGQIANVEVSIDGGAWQPAKLAADDGSPLTWTFWTYDWGTPTAGEHTVASRATAADGSVQPAPDDPYLAGKKTYWESNGQITRHVKIPASTSRPPGHAAGRTRVASDQGTVRWRLRSLGPVRVREAASVTPHATGGPDAPTAPAAAKRSRHPGPTPPRSRPGEVCRASADGEFAHRVAGVPRADLRLGPEWGRRGRGVPPVTPSRPPTRAHDDAIAGRRATAARAGEPLLPGHHHARRFAAGDDGLGRHRRRARAGQRRRGLGQAAEHRPRAEGRAGRLRPGRPEALRPDPRPGRRHHHGRRGRADRPLRAEVPRNPVPVVRRPRPSARLGGDRGRVDQPARRLAGTRGGPASGRAFAGRWGR